MSPSVVALGPRLLDFSARLPMTETQPKDGPRRLSLLWWVFLPNGAVLVVAFLLLAVTRSRSARRSRPDSSRSCWPAWRRCSC